MDNKFIEDLSNNENISNINVSEIGENSLDNLSNDNNTKNNKKKNLDFGKIKDIFELLKEKINSYIDEKGYSEQKELIIFEIRDNILLIILFIITLILGYIVFNVSGNFIKEYEKNLKELNTLKKEIITYQKKTEGNNNYKSFSDLLQYGTEINGNFYPSKGYLTELLQLFPKKEDLNFGTFTEGWTSDFKDWRGEKIRIPKDILKEYKIVGEEEIDSNYKKITYNLKLEGNDADITKYLSLLSNLKLINNLSEISETKNGNITTTDIVISFMLSK